MAVSDEQIKWYNKQDYKPQEDKKVEPTATISAGAIVLNKEAAKFFTEDERIKIGTSKRGARKVLLQAERSGDAYAPFKGKWTKKGDKLSIRCKPFVDDVLMGDYNMDFAQALQCKVTLDDQKKRVVISLA